MEDNQDFSKMIDSAMALSKLFKNSASTPSEQATESSFNPDTVLKMMDMMKMFSSSKSEQTSKPKEEINILSVVENDMNTPAINTIKSALPFLEAKYQMCLFVALKLVEIQMVVSKYKEKGEA